MNDIQWFPGHMTKTLRVIEREVSNVDLIIEMTDARLPESSRSPEVIAATASKPHLIVLNKADLADNDATNRWMAYFRAEGVRSISANSVDRRSRESAKKAIIELAVARSGRAAGLKPRAMIVGVPNAGKSTFINCLAGTKMAKAEDRPGVTRGKQWISLDFVELLDMPGVLRKKFPDQEIAAKLAFTGAIKDDILDIETLAVNLIDIFKEHYPDNIKSRYGIDIADADSYDILCRIAIRRGKLISGGEPDTEKAAAIILDEYRAGKLGLITLEEPPKND